MYHDNIEVAHIIKYKSGANAKKAFEYLIMDARKGNVASSFELAKLFLVGGWDYRAIQDDMCLGNFIPEPEDIYHDPYLIVPRDTNTALFYCQRFDKGTKCKMQTNY